MTDAHLNPLSDSQNAGAVRMILNPGGHGNRMVDSGPMSRCRVASERLTARLDDRIVDAVATGD